MECYKLDAKNTNIFITNEAYGTNKNEIIYKKNART